MDRGRLPVAGGGPCAQARLAPGGAELALSGAVRARFTYGGAGEGSIEMKLLERVHVTIKREGHSPQTEEAYAHWIVEYIRFHYVRHAMK